MCVYVDWFSRTIRNKLFVELYRKWYYTYFEQDKNDDPNTEYKGTLQNTFTRHTHAKHT